MTTEMLQLTEQYNIPIDTLIKIPYDPDSELKRELDRLDNFLDVTRPDRSMFIRPDDEEQKAWDSWYSTRVDEINKREEAYRASFRCAVESGRCDASDANKWHFNELGSSGKFERLRREAANQYFSHRNW